MVKRRIGLRFIIVLYYIQKCTSTKTYKTSVTNESQLTFLAISRILKKLGVTGKDTVSLKVCLEYW